MLPRQLGGPVRRRAASFLVGVLAVLSIVTPEMPAQAVECNDFGTRYSVCGDILAKYMAMGGPDGMLGVPISNEMAGFASQVRVSHFNGGDIYWTPGHGATDQLPQDVANVGTTQDPPATPPPLGRRQYSFNFELDPTAYVNVPSDPDFAFAELEDCFNCNFPIGPSPRNFPAQGQLLPLNPCGFMRR